ncbi:DEAD/DEAH box helicase family protein [Streptomyces syringium]|uniref:DEAD/DEAH box helicase family protein n=1 Tax=Streptomyces syringium TaxID=76729 RepID=UPI003AAD3099
MTESITLHPYQHQAVEAISAGLAEGGRGQLPAARGSGKTLISVLAATRLVLAEGLLSVFVPSLALERDGARTGTEVS